MLLKRTPKNKNGIPGVRRQQVGNHKLIALGLNVAAAYNGLSDGRLLWSFDTIIFGRGKLKCSDRKTHQNSSDSLPSTNIT